MEHISLGDLDVSRIGLGAMGMSAFYAGAGSDDAESIRTIHRALDLGVTLIDTAGLYGPFTNEELVGRAIAGRRDEVVLATKFGVYSHATRSLGIDSSPENIRVAVEGSLRRLGTDHIDLYYQHRVDPSVPIEDVMGTLAGLVHEGTIRHIGLSEAGPSTIRRANAVHPVSALQTEFSLWTRDVQAEILPIVRELGIGFVAYSPSAADSSPAPSRPPQTCPQTTSAPGTRASPRRTSRATSRWWTRSARSPPRPPRLPRRWPSPGCSPRATTSP